MPNDKKIDDAMVVFECELCKNRKEKNFAVYEDADGGPDLERLIQFINGMGVKCPKCMIGIIAIEIKLSNKILNHQGARQNP